MLFSLIFQSYGILFFTLCILILPSLFTSEKEPTNFSSTSQIEWNEFHHILQQYVTQNFCKQNYRFNAFDYGTMRNNVDQDLWSQMLNQFQEIDIQMLTPKEYKSMLINLYNMFIINKVVKNPCLTSFGFLCWPIRSIWDITDLSGGYHGVWNEKHIPLAQIDFSFNDIENKLRSLNDPRIHMAIVCASISCPDIQPEPFLPERLDLQLDEATRQFLKNPDKGMRLTIEQDHQGYNTSTISISQIFKWYRHDFLKYLQTQKDDPLDSHAIPTKSSMDVHQEDSIVSRLSESGSESNNFADPIFEFIEPYAPNHIKPYLKQKDTLMDYLPYNWDLNSKPFFSQSCINEIK